MTVPTDKRTAETSGKATILITPPGTGGDAFVRAVLGDRATDDPESLAFGQYIAGTDGAVFCLDRARRLLTDRPPAPRLRGGRCPSSRAWGRTQHQNGTG